MMLPLWLFTLLAGAGATLQGTLRAEVTREAVAYARVEILELGRAAVSDATGHFVIADVPQGRFTAEATALGYDTVRIAIVSSGAGLLRVDFELPRRPVRLGALPVGIDVTRARGSVSAGDEPGPPPSRLAGAGQLRFLPGLAEPDVLRALQQLPSVGAISDFSSGLYVRGGASDQNLVMLDGVPLFNPYHVGGVFSAITADAVAGVEVWPGALPAHEGDRLSSAVHIAVRDGARDRTHASGAIGVISSHVTADGPVGSGGSWLVSGRRTYLDAATRGLYAVGVLDVTLPYGFWDVLTKWTHDVGPLGRLSFTGYINRERVNVPSRMRDEVDANAQLAWGSRVAGLSYRQPLGSSTMWSSRVALTDFTGDFDLWDWTSDMQCGPAGCEEFPSDTTHALTGTTSARNLIAESDLTWHSRAHAVRTGVRLDHFDFAHELETEEDEDWLLPFAERAGRSTLAAFIEDEWRVSDALQLRPGVRLLHAGELGTAWLPRLSARLRLTPRLAFTAGAGRYAQAIRSMRTDESAVSSLIAYDVLTLQPAEAGLARGSDIVAGVHFDAAATSVRLDIYRKTMSGLVLPYRPADAVSLPPLVRDTFDVGRGSARGVELHVRHRTGALELNGAYAWTSVRRSTAEESYVPRFERRHVLDVSALMSWGARGIVSTRAVFGTGQPYTRVIGRSNPYRFNPVTGQFEHAGSGTLIVGEYNGERLPSYFRLDIAARRTYDRQWFGRAIQLTPYVQVLNVLNTRNVLLTEPQPHTPSYNYWPQLPVFPTLGVEWRF